ncbi:MAG: AAA family ATPase [Pseudomonadota bacterium]
MAAVLKFRNALGDARDVDLSRAGPTEFQVLIKSAHDADLAERGWACIQQRDEVYGDCMPWEKTQKRIRFRPGEVTAWIGPNRDGKSLLLGYLAAHWALQETPVLMCSLEMDIGTQLKRLSRQFLGTETPDKAVYDMLAARLFYLDFFDYTGHVPAAKMAAIVRFAASQATARHIIIDNLTLIVPPSRDSDAQAASFVRDLVVIARDTGTHIHLVAHVRKPMDDRVMLNRYDWRGTGACPDMVSNVIIVQGNERKRRAVAKGDSSRVSEADVFVTVDKQRNGEFHGQLKFWWRPAALQLVEYGSDEPYRFDPTDLTAWEKGER